MTKYITELLNFEQLIGANHFVIPDYQRGYSWEERQLEDFKEDILKASQKEYRHYTGTIVLTPSNQNANLFEIVDGQQRVTTITILLSCIYLKDRNKYSWLFEKYIQRGRIGNERAVLLTNQETRTYFLDTVIHNQERTPEIKSHECILLAKNFFNQWFKEEGVELDDILEVVLKKLGFLCYAPVNTKDIGIMFEVINNRGKDLSELEKIKNYFIYLTSVYDKYSLREKINQRWGHIQLCLNKADVVNNDAENQFLRNCYIVFYKSNKAESWHVYEKLKEVHPSGETDTQEIDGHIKTISEFVDFMEASALHYAYLLNGQHFIANYTGDKKAEIALWLKRLRCQHTKASILPLYLATMTYLDTPDVVVEFLEWIEKVNFRLYILTKITGRADTEQGNLFWLAYNLFHDKNKGWDTSQSSDHWDNHTVKSEKPIDGNHLDWVKANLRDIVDYYCPERKFVQSLTLDFDENDDYYRWKGIRYFLASFEERLQKRYKNRFDIEEILIRKDDPDSLLNDVLSIEHVWAAKNREEDFPASHIEKRRLGNFVLMGLSKNIQLQNGDVEDKVDELINNESSLIKLRQISVLSELLSESKLYVQDKIGNQRKTKNYFKNLSTRINDQRETEMISFALERWALPGEKLRNFLKVDTFEAHNNGQSEPYFLKKQ